MAVLGAAVGLCLMTSCAPSASPAASDAEWAVTYEAAKRGSSGEEEFLRDRRILERIRSSLAARVRLPGGVQMVARSCKDAEAEYDPETGRISVCYEFVAETRELFRDAGRPHVDEHVTGTLRETLYHEAAHALIDKWDLPVLGREEDVADQLAAYLLVQEGPRGQRHLAAAADSYRLYAEDSDLEDLDFSDEHAPDAARAANYRCWLYGADPKAHRRLVDGTVLTEDRSEGCEEEWRAVRRGWEHFLKPHRDAS